MSCWVYCWINELSLGAVHLGCIDNYLDIKNLMAGSFGAWPVPARRGNRPSKRGGAYLSFESKIGCIGSLPERQRCRRSVPKSVGSTTRFLQAIDRYVVEAALVRMPRVAIKRDRSVHRDRRGKLFGRRASSCEQVRSERLVATEQTEISHPAALPSFAQVHC